MPKQFPYYARFDSIVKASVSSGLDKYLSKASLEDLKRLNINEVVDLEKNIDLIGTVFNAAVINRLNRNDDGMGTKTALAIKNLFVHKPHNLEHKSQRIVGHIVKAGWSSFGDNKLLSDEEVASMTEPFNLVLGGVVYRLIDEKFANLLIEASDETSDKYLTIATSWEVGFTDFHIVVGSKNLNEAEIISDPEKIKELKQYLKAFGGPGKLPDGTYVGRLIVGEVGDVLPIGMAFTSSPAAEVEGVGVSDWSDFISEDEASDDDDSDDNDEDEYEENDASIQKNEQNNSQTSKSDVKENNHAYTDMPKITDIKQLIAAATSKEGLSEASAAEFIQSQIEQKSAEWEAKVTAKENEARTALEKASGLEAQLASATTKITELEGSLNQLKSQADAKAKEEAFQHRMSAIASEFELSEKETQIVAKEIRVLDETAYASWYEKFAVFADSKKKSNIAAAKADFEAKVQEEVAKASKKPEPTAATTNVSTASQTATTEQEKADVAKAALENTSETTASIPNAASGNQTVDVRKEWKDAFGGDNIKISK